MDTGTAATVSWLIPVFFGGFTSGQFLDSLFEPCDFVARALRLGQLFAGSDRVGPM